MKLWVWLLLIVAFLAFCVFCYDKSAEKKMGELKTQVRGQAKEIAILRYAVSITPEEVRGEVFFDRIKENFPHVENYTELLYLIKIKKTEKEAEKTEGTNKEDKTQVAQGV